MADIDESRSPTSSSSSSSAPKRRRRRAPSLGSSFGNSFRSLGRVASNAGREIASQRSNGYNNNRNANGYGASGSGGYGNSGYNVGSNSSGVISKPAPPPPPISIKDFLAKDTTFRSQQSAYKQAINDYAAQYGAELKKYGGEYGAGVDKVGVERTQGLSDLANDYASRGLIGSGVYGDAVTKYNTDIDTRLADMLRAKQAYENDLLTGKTNFQKEQQALLDKAKQDALNRRLDMIG